MSENTQQQFSLHLWLFILVLVEAVASRFYGLDRIGLWSDEIWAVSESSHRTLAGMFDYIREHESHPPGHYLLLRVVQDLFGNSAFAVRLPSALFGVMTVILLYRIGSRYFSETAGLISAALLAGSYQSIFFSQEARANIIVSFFVLLSVHFLYQLVKRKDLHWQTCVGYWISAIVTSYLHYVGLVVVLCQALIAAMMLLRAATLDGSVRYRQWLWIFSPVILAYLPWVPGTYYHLVAGPVEPWQIKPTTYTLWQTVLFLMSNDLARIWIYLIFITGFFLIWLYIWVVFLYRRYTGQCKVVRDLDGSRQVYFLLYLLLLIVLPVALFYFKSRIGQPVYNSRHFLYVLPLMLLYVGYIVSLFIATLPKLSRSFVLSGIVILIILYQSYFNVHAGLYSKADYKEDYRGAVKVIAEDRVFLRNAQHVIFSSTSFFDHYLRRYVGSDETSDLVYSTPDQIMLIRQYLSARDITQFYYLGAADERIINIRNLDGETRLQALAYYYQPVCRSALHRTHVIKFSGVAIPGQVVDYKALPLCPYGG